MKILVGLRAQPARGGTVILSFSLTKAAETSIKVRSLIGREIAWIEERKQRMAGQNTVLWNGRDREGRPLPAGVYLIHATATDEEGRQVSAVTTLRLTR